MNGPPECVEAVMEVLITFSDPLPNIFDPLSSNMGSRDRREGELRNREPSLERYRRNWSGTGNQILLKIRERVGFGNRKF